MIKSCEEILIYESPDGGKTVYSRKMGEPHNSRTLHSIDAVYQKEQALSSRWANLKGAVFMADNNPTLDDAISKVEMLYVLLKQEQS